MEEEEEEEVSSTTETSVAAEEGGQQHKRKKSVTFSPDLTIRTHRVVLGDSPSCPLLPLTLDWCYDEEVDDLEEFENAPSTKRRRRRGPKKLLFYERSERLQEVGGHSPTELHVAKMRAILRMKKADYVSMPSTSIKVHL
jgi:hypothetical protein